MKELIELVNDFETSHSEVPTEDFTIVYCEASGEPAQWANDLQLRQKAMRQNKNLQEHTKHLANIIGQATTQVAASFIKGSQPKAKMKDAILHQIKKPQRSVSTKHGRIPIFSPRFGARTNTKQEFVLAFQNKYLKS